MASGGENPSAAEDNTAGRIAFLFVRRSRGQPLKLRETRRVRSGG